MYQPTMKNKETRAANLLDVVEIARAGRTLPDRCIPRGAKMQDDK